MRLQKYILFSYYQTFLSFLTINFCFFKPILFFQSKNMTTKLTFILTEFKFIAKNELSPTFQKLRPVRETVQVACCRHAHANFNRVADGSGERCCARLDC